MKLSPLRIACRKLKALLLTGKDHRSLPTFRQSPTLDPAPTLAKGAPAPTLRIENADSFLHLAEECVRGNIGNEDFDKNDFARALLISPSLLYKRIKALTGLSVVHYIRKCRLDYSMQLLRDGDISVIEVSERCGFASPSYFSRVFKKHFGLAPSEIRRSLSSNV